MRRSASNAESDGGGGGGGWQAGGGAGPSTSAGPGASSDDLVLLLSVSVISACCLCWFLEHLDYLLRPLVFALGIALILRPFVDFASDWRYQRPSSGGGTCEPRGTRAWSSSRERSRWSSPCR